MCQRATERHGRRRADRPAMTNPSPEWMQAVTVLLAVTTSGLAFLVYRLNADKLFHDMRDPRAEAHRRLIEAMDVYQDVVVNRFPIGGFEALNVDLLPAQTNLFQAAIEARLLFGNEYQMVLDDYDSASLRLLHARSLLTHDGSHLKDDPAGLDLVRGDFHRAVTAMLNIRFEHHRAAAPYLRVGRRGLSAGTRLRLGLFDLWGWLGHIVESARKLLTRD